MVTRARFERATPSFGGWCSIQLSYRATLGRSAGFGALGFARAPSGDRPEKACGGAYWIRTSDLCGVNTAL